MLNGRYNFAYHHIEPDVWDESIKTCKVCGMIFIHSFGNHLSVHSKSARADVHPPPKEFCATLKEAIPEPFCTNYKNWRYYGECPRNMKAKKGPPTHKFPFSEHVNALRQGDLSGKSEVS